uniref:Uncharacterized protein n=1 Tax=Rhizophagus irregularis (strain DAOM 181602 / DAOM 197198 / MUCL 43194) TaxID=747089 RepID=U9TJH3_RHIID
MSESGKSGKFTEELLGSTKKKYRRSSRVHRVLLRKKNRMEKIREKEIGSKIGTA